MACPSIGISTDPTLARFVYYKLLTHVPVSAAITAMLRHGESLTWPFLYVGLCLAHAGAMNAAKCPHCPCYKMGEGTFACFIWWGAPKLWARRVLPPIQQRNANDPFGNCEHQLQLAFSSAPGMSVFPAPSSSKLLRTRQ